MVNESQSGTWDRILSALSQLAVASYVGCYILVPGAYVVGPAVLLLLVLAGFRWSAVAGAVDRESLGFMLAFVAYFALVGLTLLLHGEDVSEFDLLSRCLAAALVLAFVLKYPPSMTAFYLAAAIGCIAAGLFALYQGVLHDVSRVSSFDNPVHFGNGAMVLAVVSLSGLIWGRAAPMPGFWAALMVAGFLGGLTASLLSGTRSGWVALPLFIAVWLAAYWPEIRAHKRWAAIALVATSALLLFVVSLPGVQFRIDRALDEFQGYVQDGRNATSVGLRLDMWKTGLTAFQQSPFIGVGPTAYESIEREMIDAGEVHPNIADFRHLHNQFIDVLAKAGLVGLIGYLLMLAIPCLLFLRHLRSPSSATRALAVAGACFMLGHGAFNLTQSLLERNIGVMMFAFMPVFIWSLLARQEVAR
ncbi:MAG: O-antigen ligase family protein [Marinobacter sp.]|uniref:O-antigen ligase family protein n=1 Tax=Marinobacter sp. TaxID=50741 RepID=UPI00299E9A8F|nr:O-antigen ligase family protein [Marinobacter sp.]MDX1756773.1 O-antigen ligase family protein [Marinobacter sp.]